MSCLVTLPSLPVPDILSSSFKLIFSFLAILLLMVNKIYHFYLFYFQIQFFESSSSLIEGISISGILDSTSSHSSFSTKISSCFFGELSITSSSLSIESVSISAIVSPTFTISLTSKFFLINFPLNSEGHLNLLYLWQSQQLIRQLQLYLQPLLTI